MATRLCTRSGLPVGSAIVDEFAAGLAGKAIQPGHAEYDTARQSGMRRSTAIPG